MTPGDAVIPMDRIMRTEKILSAQQMANINHIPVGQL